MTPQEFLDLYKYDTATPSLKQYLKIKSENIDNIVLFQIGDFFEMFFDDAVNVHKILGLYLTNKGIHDEKKIPMCGIPLHSYKRYVAQLAKNNYTVVICEQTESAEEAKKNNYKAVVERKITQIITPGTLSDTEMFESHDDNFLVATIVEKDQAAISYIDISTSQFYVLTCSKDTLIPEINKIQPKEILTNADSHSLLFKKFNAKLTQYPNHFCSVNKALLAFQDFFHSSNTMNYTDLEIQVIGLILNYIKITKIKNLPLLNFPKLLNNSSTMKLDMATIESLNILSIVLKTINFTCSPHGFRLLKKNLLNPLKNLTEINDRLTLTNMFLNNMNLTFKIQNILKEMTDIEREINNMNKSAINLISIAKNISLIFQLYKMNLSFVTFENIENLNNIAQKILSLFISEGDFIVNSSASNELLNLHNQLKSYEDNLDNIVRSHLAHIPSAKISKNNLVGVFIEIPKKFQSQMPDVFFLKNTTTTVNRYSSNDIAQIETKINETVINIQILEKQVLNQFYDILAQNVATIRLNVANSAFIDMIASFAVAAHKLGLSEPLIKNDVVIKNAFHIYLGRHSVKNSCTFNSVTRNYVITGPNMSGKSTFLRQTAIIFILFQIGSFVPAEYAELSVVDNVFSRIGASDDISKGHSTFMIEMLETAFILQNATERSFIVLDEVGRGTSTKEGEVMAYEILRYINEEIRCKCLFATHYHEITKNEFKNCKNLTVEILVDNEDIQFSYKIIEGYSKDSYALYTAKLAGIPKIIIDRSRIRLDARNN